MVTDCHLEVLEPDSGSEYSSPSGERLTNEVYAYHVFRETHYADKRTYPHQPPPYPFRQSAHTHSLPDHVRASLFAHPYFVHFPRRDVNAPTGTERFSLV